MGSDNQILYSNWLGFNHLTDGTSTSSNGIEHVEPAKMVVVKKMLLWSTKNRGLIRQTLRGLSIKHWGCMVLSTLQWIGLREKLIVNRKAYSCLIKSFRDKLNPTCRCQNLRFHVSSWSSCVCRVQSYPMFSCLHPRMHFFATPKLLFWFNSQIVAWAAGICSANGMQIKIFTMWAPKIAFSWCT